MLLDQPNFGLFIRVKRFTKQDISTDPPDQTLRNYEIVLNALCQIWFARSPKPPTSETIMSDSVGQYLNEIGLVPLLTAAEERELSQIIEKGVEARERLADGEKGVELKRADRKAAEAKDRFIRANLRLVVSVALSLIHI